MTDEVEWHKSSHSMSSGNCVETAWTKSSASMGSGNCVESKARTEPTPWVKSTYSMGTGNCVETAVAEAPIGSELVDDGVVLVRDTKDREGLVLSFLRGEWRGFIQGVKEGQWDDYLAEE